MQSRWGSEPQHLCIVCIWSVKNKSANFCWIGHHAEGKRTQFIDTGWDWCRFRGVMESPCWREFVPNGGSLSHHKATIGSDIEHLCAPTGRPMSNRCHARIGFAQCSGQRSRKCVTLDNGSSGVDFDDRSGTRITKCEQLLVLAFDVKFCEGVEFIAHGPCPCAQFCEGTVSLQWCDSHANACSNGESIGVITALEQGGIIDFHTLWHPLIDACLSCEVCECQPIPS